MGAEHPPHHRARSRKIAQNRLAQESGVPLTTVNSWATGASLPRDLDQLAAAGAVLARWADERPLSGHKWDQMLQADQAARGIRLPSARRDASGHTAGRVVSESGLPGRPGEFFMLAKALSAFRAGPLSGAPSDRTLARAARVSPTTVGDWLQGRRFPQDVDRFVIIVRTIRATTTARGIASPAASLQDYWMMTDGGWHTSRRRCDGLVPSPMR